MIAVAVSMANGCLYCLVAHGAALREALGDPILADRITLDYRRAGLDERRTAILDYVTKVTKNPLDCTPEDLTRLQECGLTEEETWDVVEIASMYNFTNRMSLVCGMTPNEEYQVVDHPMLSSSSDCSRCSRARTAAGKPRAWPRSLKMTAFFSQSVPKALAQRAVPTLHMRSTWLVFALHSCLPRPVSIVGQDFLW